MILRNIRMLRHRVHLRIAAALIDCALLIRERGLNGLRRARLRGRVDAAHRLAVQVGHGREPSGAQGRAHHELVHPVTNMREGERTVGADLRRRHFRGKVRTIRKGNRADGAALRPPRVKIMIHRLRVPLRSHLQNPSVPAAPRSARCPARTASPATAAS